MRAGTSDIAHDGMALSRERARPRRSAVPLTLAFVR